MGKKIIILFSLALIVRLVALSFFDNSQSLIHKDSEDYVAVAENLVTRGIYSMDTGPDISSDNFRTPIYPFFLVPFVYLGASPYAVAIAQDILTAMGITLIYHLGRKVFSKRVAFGGTRLFSLEPCSALIANQLLTEWLFTLTLAPALLLLALYTKEGGTSNLYISTILFALSALTKPLALPLLPLIVITALFVKRDKSVIISALIMIMVIAPWIVRNKLVIDRWSFSTIGEYNLYNYNAKHFDRWLSDRGIQPQGDDAYPEISLQNYHRPEKADAYLEAGKNFILNKPFAYLEFILLKLPAFFLDTGYSTLSDGLETSPRVTKLVLFLGSIFFLLVTILAALNYKQKFFIIILMALAIIASPFGAARYRVAINPILFMLALDSLFIFYNTFRKRAADTGPDASAA